MWGAFGAPTVFTCRLSDVHWDALTSRLFFSETFFKEVFDNRNWKTHAQKSVHLTLKTTIASFSFASRHHFPVTIHNILFRCHGFAMPNYKYV